MRLVTKRCGFLALVLSSSVVFAACSSEEPAPSTPAPAANTPAANTPASNTPKANDAANDNNMPPKTATTDTGGGTTQATADDDKSDKGNATIPPAAPSAELIAKGETAFKSGSCIRCHGDTGAGGQRGPDLTDEIWAQCDGSLAGIQGIIHSGVPKENISDAEKYKLGMNSAEMMKLAPETVEALAAYVWSLSHKSGQP